MAVPAIREQAPKVRHQAQQALRRKDSVEPWNAIVTARGDRLPQARRVLRALGCVERTGFYNVLAMNVDDPEHRIDRLERLFAEHPAAVEAVAHIFPAERCFEFSSPAESESKAREVALAWVPRLAGKTLHVRVHRRGRKGTLVSPEAERAIADALLAAFMRRANRLASRSTIPTRSS